MTQQELNALVGKEFMIRGARHICLAASAGSLLFLQICARDEPLFKTGDPVQYVVARHPSWYDGKLTWGSGSYYPLYAYGNGSQAEAASGLALLDAALRLTGDTICETTKGGTPNDPENC